MSKKVKMKPNVNVGSENVFKCCNVWAEEEKVRY